MQVDVPYRFRAIISILYVPSIIMLIFPNHALLPPANEVWGKVIFLHLFVILFTGGWYPSMHCRWYPSMPCSRRCGIPACIAGGIPACIAVGIPACLAAGGAWSGGSALGGAWSEGGLLRGGGGSSPGGDPPDGYCCGRYASYWNALFFVPDIIVV